MTSDPSALSRLQTVLQGYSSLLVAYSGGVDSTLLLKAAVDTLGPDRVEAVTARSPLRPQVETDRAVRIADQLGVRHTLIDSDELTLAEVAGNHPDRCYHCKRGTFARCVELAAVKGLAAVCDGSNLDDQECYRPGHRAIDELGVRSPLVEARLTKNDIRQISRDLGLETWDLPSYSCLATRFPYHTQLSTEALKQVEVCEDWLRAQGFSGFRLRHHGEIARLEFAQAQWEKALAAPMRQQLIQFLKQAGFAYVCLDLEGFRSGSMDIHLTS